MVDAVGQLSPVRKERLIGGWVCACRETESKQFSLPFCKVAQQIFGKENKLLPQIRKSWGQGERELERDAPFYLSHVYI